MADAFSDKKNLLTLDAFEGQFCNSI